MAARRAALTTDCRFLRVLDAAISIEADQHPSPAEPADSRIGPYIVSEYAPGRLLLDVLPTGPLSALEAAWLVREVADRLVGMHAQGAYHGHLSPDTVVLTTDGNIKIVGFLLEAELASSHQAVRDPEAVDVRDLGRLLGRGQRHRRCHPRTAVDHRRRAGLRPGG